MPLSSPSYSIKIPFTFIRVVLTTFEYIGNWKLGLSKVLSCRHDYCQTWNRWIVCRFANSLVCDDCLVPATLVVILLDVFLLKPWKRFYFWCSDKVLFFSNIQKKIQGHLYSLAWKDLMALTVHFVRFPGSDVTKIIWTSNAISFRTKDVRFLSFSFVMNRLDDPLDKAEQLRSIDFVLNRNWIWFSRCCKMQKRCTSAPSNALLIF